MKETRAYHRLKTRHPSAHWQRVEGYTTTGAFDSNACKNGVEIWVEFKEAERPKKTTTLIKAKKVRPSQISWEYLGRQAGRRMFIALMVENDMFVLKGEYIATIRDGVSEKWLRENTIDPNIIFIESPKLPAGIFDGVEKF